jgi:hypothetical protein
MGRGRSKARQTRVARDLKYSNHEMDLTRLAEELHQAQNLETPKNYALGEKLGDTKDNE